MILVKLVALIITLTCSQSLFANPNRYYDYIYKDNATALYDATTEQEFRSAKRQAYLQVVLNGRQPAALLGALYGAYWAYTRYAPAPPQLGALGFFFAGLAQSILAPYTYNIQEPISGFIHSVRNYVLGPPEDAVHQLELHYIQIKPQLTPRTQLAVESRFEKIRTAFDPQDLSSSPSQFDQKLDAVKQILALPVSSKPIIFDNRLFLNEFSGYQNMASANPIPELQRFCHSLAIASRHTNPKLKSALYLEGAPGVGKTEAVFRLGKVLGIPVIKINLAEFPNIGQIKGTSCEDNHDENCGPGLIASSLIANSKLGYTHKNALLFFDEADQVLNRVHEGQGHELVSFMLDFLEGKTQFIDNPYFEKELDVRHFGIILAGNNPLVNKALQSRLNTLYFGNYTVGYRIQAGRERFLPEVLQDYAELLKLEDFSESDFEKIDLIAKAEHQKLLATGEDPGFRNQIRQIERFVHQKALGSPSEILSAN